MIEHPLCDAVASWNWRDNCKQEGATFKGEKRVFWGGQCSLSLNIFIIRLCSVRTASSIPLRDEAHSSFGLLGSRRIAWPTYKKRYTHLTGIWNSIWGNFISWRGESLVMYEHLKTCLLHYVLLSRLIDKMHKRVTLKERDLCVSLSVGEKKRGASANNVGTWQLVPTKKIYHRAVDEHLERWHS